MNLRTRSSRRLTAATAIACVAIGLPAVALAAASSPSRPATRRVHCRAHLRVARPWPQRRGQAPSIYPVEFTNLGTTKCILSGTRRLRSHQAGHQLGPAAGRFSAKRHNVTLKPGQTAHAALGIVRRRVHRPLPKRDRRPG